jgi:hypothetical protein
MKGMIFGIPLVIFMIKKTLQFLNVELCTPSVVAANFAVQIKNNGKNPDS